MRLQAIAFVFDPVLDWVAIGSAKLSIGGREMYTQSVRIDKERLSSLLKLLRSLPSSNQFDQPTTLKVVGYDRCSLLCPLPSQPEISGHLNQLSELSSGKNGQPAAREGLKQACGALVSELAHPR